MGRLGVLHAASLLGRELVERLGAAFPDAELHLLTRDPEEVGTLDEAGAMAVLHELADVESLARLDVLVLAGARDEDLEALLAGLGGGALLLVVSPSQFLAPAAPLIAGVNDWQAVGPRLLHSPHSVTVALSLLLEPLLDLEPQQVTVTAVLPVSERDKAGIDELVEQTRALLTFRSALPQDELGAQLAYNLLPASDPVSCEAAGAQLGAVLGRRVRVDLTLLRAGLFHGVAMSVTCRFAGEVDLDQVRRRLAAAPLLSLSTSDSAPGAIDAATHEEALVAVLGPGASADHVRFWIVIDHLVRGGAANAVAVLAAALAGQAAPAQQGKTH